MARGKKSEKTTAIQASASAISRAEEREREREQLGAIWGARSEKRGLAPSRRTVVSAPPRAEGDKPPGAPPAPGADGDDDGDDEADSDVDLAPSRKNPKVSDKVLKAKKVKQDQARAAKLVIPIPADKDRLDVMKALVKFPPTTCIVKPQASTGIKVATVTYPTPAAAAAAVEKLNGKRSTALGCTLSLSAMRSRREQANLRWKRSLTRRGVDANRVKSLMKHAATAAGDEEGKIDKRDKTSAWGGLAGVVS